jgi:hypothetical protein
VPEAATPVLRRQRLLGEPLDDRQRQDQELGNAIPSLDAEDLLGVVVDEHDGNLVSVAGVDQSRSIEAGHTPMERKPAPWQDEGREPLRQAEHDPGRHRRTSAAGLEIDVAPRPQVHRSVAGTGVARQRELRVDLPDGDPKRWCHGPDRNPRPARTAKCSPGPPSAS